MMAYRKSALAWLLLSVVVIAVDQGSKQWVVTCLPEYTAVPVIDGIWNWLLTANSGFRWCLSTWNRGASPSMNCRGTQTLRLKQPDLLTSRRKSAWVNARVVVGPVTAAHVTESVTGRN